MDWRIHMRKVIFCAMLLLAACGTKEEVADGMALTATLFTGNNEGVIQQLENEDNILIPYIAEKFGLQIEEFLEIPPDLRGQPAQAALLWASGDMLPDLMTSGAEEFGSLVGTDLFRPLDEFLNKLPNYTEVLPTKFWPREANPKDGKTYAIYGPYDSWPPDKNKIAADDVVTPGRDPRSLWVREDVLKAVGYSFTPVAQLKSETLDRGIRPTAEQLRLEPPIDSPEAFMDLLRKIKNSGLKTPDGRDIIPFTMPYWEVWHLGVMYDNGYWRITRDGEVDGYLGLPGFQPLMRWFWTAYREGLIDQDFLVQKGVQMQEKVAAGMVAAGEYVPNSKVVFEQLQQNIPGADIHPIPFPKTSAERGFFDTYTPFSYTRVLVNKNLPDAVVDKIANLVDWLYTDEGREISTWGPESVGLYRVEEGKRRFVSEELKEGMLQGAQSGEGPYKYGLYDFVLGLPTTPILAAIMPGGRRDLLLVPRAYNYGPDSTALFRSIVASQPRFSGLPRHLEVANSDQSPEVSAVADWYWNIFFQTYLPQILKANDEDEFATLYQQTIDAFMSETNYPAAKKRMTEYFEKFPAEW